MSETIEPYAVNARHLDGSTKNGDGALYLNYNQQDKPIYMNGGNTAIHSGNIGTYLANKLTIEDAPQNTDMNTITSSKIVGITYTEGTNQTNLHTPWGDTMPNYSTITYYNVETISYAGGYRLCQIAYSCFVHNPGMWYRIKHDASWGKWNKVSIDGHTHNVSQISGVLPADKGGTGVTSIDALKNVLGIGSGGTSLTYRTVTLRYSQSITLYDSNCVSVGVTRLESSGSSQQGGSYYSGMIPYSALKLPYSYSGEIYSVEALGYVRGTAHTPVVLAEIQYREYNKTTIISCPDNQSSCTLTIIES